MDAITDTNTARLRWTEPAPGSFKVAGILDIETADAFRQILLEILARISKLPQGLSGADLPHLDLSDIEVCGTPGIQLLLSAQRSAASEGIVLKLCAPSPPVEKAFARFGMSGHFSQDAEVGLSIL
jgi:anti-anti-sigma regulatory factor